jgi:hypothetical protein
MAFSDITSRQAVLDAIAEYDRLGQAAFLDKYGYGEARYYLLEHDGRVYDSKAIVGVAHGYQFPDAGPLRAKDFCGGYATVEALLKRLRFDVQVKSRPAPRER